ncbi:YtfJ family protein [Polluticoccus soli]|uniref:YtfJ family protein n=1 Tax=Polluticoccus soli TaxID=3034150 RepID=UPI0023E15C8F|nr:YtfJ family protein [Flavipsychrobacter sp. JY13-12]
MKRIFLSALLCGVLIDAGAQHIVNPGRMAINIDLLDARGNKQNLPLGHKVTAVFYTDPDAKDVINPLSEAMEKRKLPKDKFIGVGVINCKDTWVPNSAMKISVRQKEKQSPGSVILFDENKALAKEWSLGDCNNACVLVIVGMDSRVKYAKAIRSQEECRAAMGAIMKLLEEEIGKS